MSYEGNDERIERLESVFQELSVIIQKLINIQQPIYDALKNQTDTNTIMAKSVVSAGRVDTSILRLLLSTPVFNDAQTRQVLVDSLTAIEAGQKANEAKLAEFEAAAKAPPLLPPLPPFGRASFN